MRRSSGEPEVLVAQKYALKALGPAPTGVLCALCGRGGASATGLN